MHVLLIVCVCVCVIRRDRGLGRRSSAATKSDASAKCSWWHRRPLISTTSSKADICQHFITGQLVRRAHCLPVWHHHLYMHSLMAFLTDSTFAGRPLNLRDVMFGATRHAFLALTRASLIGCCPFFIRWRSPEGKDIDCCRYVGCPSSLPFGWLVDSKVIHLAQVYL